ncbi:MAG: hypothetical protein LR017_00595 [Candidatus Pacebacteria bacterium]|nr:hypothetical protein [Candidatus Paceibacterota bacterium]
MRNRDDYLVQHIEENIRTTEQHMEKLLAEMDMGKKAILHDKRDLLEVRQKAEHLLTQITNAKRGIQDLEEQYIAHKREYDEGRKAIAQQDRDIKMLGDQARGLKIKQDKMRKKLDQVRLNTLQEKEGTRY